MVYRLFALAVALSSCLAQASAMLPRQIKLTPTASVTLVVPSPTSKPPSRFPHEVANCQLAPAYQPSCKNLFQLTLVNMSQATSGMRCSPAMFATKLSRFTMRQDSLSRVCMYFTRHSFPLRLPCQLVRMQYRLTRSSNRYKWNPDIDVSSPSMSLFQIPDAAKSK
jgi:hypothetical protein